MSQSGTKIPKDKAIAMIQAYQDTPAVEGSEKLISLDIGKEALQNILNQAGCEGIRLYFAKIDPSSQDKNYVNTSITTVVVGIDNDGDSISENDEIYDELLPCPTYCGGGLDGD